MMPPYGTPSTLVDELRNKMPRHLVYIKILSPKLTIFYIKCLKNSTFCTKNCKKIKKICINVKKLFT